MLVPIKFVVTSPGKIILFGEHSVVYGKQALAAAINKRTSLFFETTVSNCVEIKFSDLKYEIAIPLEFVSCITGLNEQNLNRDELMVRSEKDTEKLENSTSFNREQKVSIRCVFYLLRGIFMSQKLSNAFRINISSELFLGGGTGSSASFSVCLAAAFHRYSQILNFGVDNLKLEFTPEDLEKIDRWAFNCDSIIHGKSSGLDNATCTYGSIVKMLNTFGVDGNRMTEILPNIVPLRILLINSRVSRSSAAMVRKVADLRNQNPSVVDGILYTMDEIVKSVCLILNEMKIQKNSVSESSEAYNETFSRLEKLVCINQGLLSGLGVSHESLDDIVNITKKYNLHAKLTGAGGGGNSFALVSPMCSQGSIQNCIEALENKGYSVTDLVIGDGGVNIKFL